MGRHSDRLSPRDFCTSFSLLDVSPSHPTSLGSKTLALMPTAKFVQKASRPSIVSLDAYVHPVHMSFPRHLSTIRAALSKRNSLVPLVRVLLSSVAAYWNHPPSQSAVTVLYEPATEG